MTRGRTTGAPERRPVEVAAEWLARRDGGRFTAEDEAALRTWIESDASHGEAWRLAQATLEAAGRHAGAPELLALRAAALSLPERRRFARWPVAAAAAAALVGVVGLGVTLYGDRLAPSRDIAVAVASGPAAILAPRPAPERAVYRTAVGERLTVSLPDGSVATLNTATRLQIDYRGGERAVRLLSGQALFQVAKDARRPFRVYAGDRRITALGTTFDVRLDGARVKVALLEGTVRVAKVGVADAWSPSEQVTMAAGEILDAAPASPTRVRVSDPEREASWRTGVMVFEDVPMSAAVAEANRYSERPIVVGDAAVGDYRVSGVFKTGDPERFAAAMAEAFPLRVERSDDGQVTLREEK